MTDDKEVLARWRLILGQFAEEELPLDGGGDLFEEDECLSFLYDREYGEERGVRGGSGEIGGRGRSVLSVPEWLKKVKKLFPKSASEIMQKDALDKYGINEILTDPDVLKNIEPDINLLSKLLQFGGTIPKELRSQADEIIKKTAEEISKKLECGLKKCFYGRRVSGSQSYYKVSANFDFKRTVEKNLKNYSTEFRTVIPSRLYFKNAVKRYNPWDVIILADESGSMVDSVIYAAVTAGIFARLPFMTVRLAVFDTAVADLSEHVYECSELMMKLQLGGGTDILKALRYAESLISKPRRTIVILITDLYDGGDIRRVYGKCADILESGAKLFVLPALDYRAEPIYNRTAAKTLARMGADVGAVTPEGLADWIANIIL